MYPEISDELNRLSNEMIGLAIKVHKAPGPGLLESSYKECLFYEIAKHDTMLRKKNLFL